MQNSKGDNLQGLLHKVRQYILLVTQQRLAAMLTHYQLQWLKPSGSYVENFCFVSGLLAVGPYSHPCGC